MSVWTKIKNWFTGASKKNSSYKTSKKGLSTSAKTTTYSTKKSNSDLKAQLAKQKAEQEAKKKRLEEAFKAKNAQVTTKAQDSNYKQNGGADKVLKKIQQKATQDNATLTSKKAMASNKTTKMPIAKVDVPKSITDTAGIKVNNNILQDRKDYTTNGAYDPAKSITRGNETSPILSAALRGGIEGSTLGISELLYKNARPDVAEALKQQEENYTKAQNRANLVGNLVGSAFAFGSATGLGKTVGSNILAKAGTSTEGVAKAIEASGFMQRLGARTGKDIAKISSKIASELTKDLGLHLTVENVQSIITSLNDNSDNPDSKAGDYIGDYIKQQAINTALNIGMDLTPLLGKAAKQISEAGALKLADQTGAVTNTNKNVSKAINLSTQGSAYTKKELTAFKQEASDIVEKAKQMVADGNEIEAARSIREKAEQIAEGIKEEVGDSAQYKELRTELRNTKLKVDNVKSDVNYSEGFRKNYAGRIKFGKDGIEIDKKYQELAQNYPELFPKDIENEADQLVRIGEVLDAIKPKYSEIPEEEIQATADYIAEAMWKETGSKETLNDALEMYPRGEFVSDEIEQGFLSAEEKTELDKMIAEDNKRFNNATSEAKAEPPKTNKTSKAKQAEIINRENPHNPDLNKDATWIKSEKDILTWDEAMADPNYNGENVTPDFTWEDAIKAKERGKITVYSSKEIKDGAFVTPSKMLAESYGAGKTYSKEVDINDVAWIDMSEGQLATITKETEFAKVDDAMAGVKEADNAKADAEAELDKAIKKNVKQAPMSKSAKQVDNARMKAERAKNGKAKKMGGKNTSFGEALKTEEIYAEKLTEDTRMGHGAANAINNARQDLYRKTTQKIAESNGFEFDVWHDKENFRKSFDKIIGMATTKKNKVDVKGVKAITADMNAFNNGTKTIAVGDESKRATFDAISAMNFCNAHYIDDTGGKILTKAEKEINKSLNELYAASVAQYAKISNAGATTLRLGKQMAEANPAARAMAVKKCVMNMLNDSLGFVRKNGKLTDADYAKFINDNKEIKEAFQRLEETSKTANKDELDRAISDVYLAVNKKVPLTLLDIVTEWRYACMLCSPKTHIRNVVGNSIFGAVREVSDQIAASKELKLYKQGKIEYLTKGKASGQAIKESHMTAKALEKSGSEKGKLSKEWYEKSKDSLFRDSTKYEMYRAGAGGKGVNALRKWGDSISKWLETEDAWAVEWRYRENFHKFLDANKYGTPEQTIKDTDKLLNLASQYSQNEALEATFRDYNAAASKLNQFMASMTKADTSLGKRALATAANATMPFVKTPFNVLKQSLNYSPIGLFKAHNSLKTAISAGDTEAINKAVEKLAKKQTGTGIVAVGAVLGALDSDMLNFRTNAGDDADEKFKKRQGFQNYSVNINNKWSATLDWATPISSVFFTGVEFGKQIRNVCEKEGIDFDTALSTAAVTASRVLDPTLETSMLSGINSALDALKNSQYDENASKTSAISQIVGNIASNYASSLVPTVLSQLSRTFAPSDYLITGESGSEYFRNQMIAKIPIASNMLLPEKTDSWGRVTGDKGVGAERVKNTALALAGNMFLPSNVKKISWDKTDEALVKEYKKTGNDSVLPNISYDRTMKVGKNGEVSGTKRKTYKLSAEDLSVYNKSRATGGEDAMASVLENIMFNRYKKNSSGNKVLTDGYTKEEKAKIIKEFKGKSTKEVAEWLMKQPQWKNASEDERRQALSTMFDNAGTKAKGNRRTAERAVWKNQGRNVNEYDFKNELSAKKQSNLQDAIDSGVITYKEAVDFARNAGKTYYYENEDGTGSSMTYYNKKEMIAYLQSKGYSYEKAEALYNAFKNSNAKAYNGSGSSGSGWSYRRSGGSKSKSTKSKIKISAYNNATYKPKSMKSAKADSSNMVDALDKALENMQKQGEKKTPPKNKEFKL